MGLSVIYLQKCLLEGSPAIRAPDKIAAHVQHREEGVIKQMSEKEQTAIQSHHYLF